MDLTFLIGLTGSLILVTGVALPANRVSHPAKSHKNWLFAAGNACMFLYAVLQYLSGGPIFFLFLQIFIAVSTVLMMFNTPDAYDTPILAAVGLGLVAWSLVLFEDRTTALIVLGLILVGVGFALENGTVRRNVALTLGSICIAWFSYFVGDVVFLWLNIFFAVFSLYHAVFLSWKRRKNRQK